MAKAKVAYQKLNLVGYPLEKLAARPGGMAGNIHMQDVLCEIVRVHGPCNFLQLTEYSNKYLKHYPADTYGDTVRYFQTGAMQGLLFVDNAGLVKLQPDYEKYL